MIVNEQVAIDHGLKKDEYAKICELLKRTPNITELGIFSAMWNEHCSYKSSRLHLKKLPTKGKQVIQGPGENAGVVDIGDNDAIVFKIESHNHPSYIEPYQGAATGVGGILRDVVCMGAQPIALVDPLFFGDLDLPRNKLPEGINGLVAMGGNVWEWVDDQKNNESLTAGASWWYDGRKTSKEGAQYKPSDFFAIYVGFRCAFDN